MGTVFSQYYYIYYYRIDPVLLYNINIIVCHNNIVRTTGMQMKNISSYVIKKKKKKCTTYSSLKVHFCR